MNAKRTQDGSNNAAADNSMPGGELLKAAKRCACAMNNEDLAGDLMVLYLTIQGSPAGFDPAKGPLAPWLRRIAKNRAVSAHRRDRLVLLPDRGEARRNPFEQLPNPGGQTPETALLAAERRRSVRNALHTLPETTQQVFELRFSEGLSLKEIADATNSTYVSVALRIHRGLRKMRAAMERSLNVDWPKATSWDRTWRRAAGIE